MTFSCNGHSTLSFSLPSSIWHLILNYHHPTLNACWNSSAVLNSISSTVGLSVSIITILLLVFPVQQRGPSGLLALCQLRCYLYSSRRAWCTLGVLVIIMVSFCDAGFGKGLVSSLRWETQKKLVPIPSCPWWHDWALAYRQTFLSSILLFCLTKSLAKANLLNH